MAAVILSINPIFNPIAYSAGRSPSAVVNTILNGKGVPKPSLGIDGDFYIDTRSLLLYGPKKKGKWPSPQNLQGPTGPAGSDGKNGSDGRAGVSNVSTVTGAQGPAGPQGERGEKGDPGTPGASGPAGAPGPSGPAGAPGANGAQGPAGPAGATGATGATGAQGPKGETGTAGSVEVTVVDIPSWTLSSATAFSFSNSTTFGNLVANKSYQIHIYISGTSVFNSAILGLELLSPGSSINFSYLRDNLRYSSNSAITTLYTFDVFGTIAVGSSNASIQIRIYDGLGDSGANPITLAGKAYITEIAAVK